LSNVDIGDWQTTTYKQTVKRKAAHRTLPTRMRSNIMTQLMIDYTVTAPETSYLAAEQLQIVSAELSDCDAVVTLFGALHSYNALLDAHFALSDDWESLLRREFCETVASPDRLWLLVKQGNRAVGLLIAAVHTDSPMFRHRRWVEVEALYVASGCR